MSSDWTSEVIATLVEETLGGTLVGPEQIVEAFYPELKRLAAAQIRRAAPGMNLQTTALVNELYMELVKMKVLRPIRPGHSREKSAFFALASQAMQWLLFRHVRAFTKVAYNQTFPIALADSRQDLDSLARIESLLRGLEKLDPQLRAVVELRVFEDLSLEETAARLACSQRTVTRHWRFARTWLREQISSTK